MITAEYVRTMAAYNRAMNQRLYNSAARAFGHRAQAGSRRFLVLYSRHVQPPAVG